MSPTVGSAHIPAVGLGTWELRGKSCTRLVAEALRLGYRHIDTAEMYDNELEVGEGLRSSGIARDEVFITTKVWPSHFAAPALERAARDSVARLRLACVDLLLLHWPNPQVPLRETIGALCKVKRNGLARHIGVSNFTVALLEEAVRLSEEPLVCNQIEVHPFLDQTKVIAATQRHHMAVVAYSPDCARPRKGSRRARPYRQGARQDRNAGELAFPAAAGHRPHSSHQSRGAAQRKPRHIRFRAHRCRHD
jgi:diketogulonate reductase-like aldo/keto reductase